MKDYDECQGQNGGNDCAIEIATCFNIPGSYYCQCNNGYFGNGTSCFGSLSFLSFSSFPLSFFKIYKQK